jgi:isoquinoline 1-oxidoreductase subunit alpha
MVSDRSDHKTARRYHNALQNADSVAATPSVTYGFAQERGVAMISLKVNGKTVQADVDASTPLLWVLRDALGLTGTKYGCGIGACGACTVLIAGTAVRSCQVIAGAVRDASITTIEGLSADGSHPVQKAWVAEQVPQCGYCQSGQLLCAAALLKDHPQPTDAQIDAAMRNICVCGTYQEMRAAIHRAAGN